MVGDRLCVCMTIEYPLSVLIHETKYDNFFLLSSVSVANDLKKRCLLKAELAAVSIHFSLAPVSLKE